jgi:hypothetical protein
MNTVTSSKLTTSKGRSVITDLTNAQAVAALATIPGDFARKLAVDAASRKGLSYDQMVWAHILAMDAKTPPPAAVQLGTLPGLVALFRQAGEKLQRPKIRMIVNKEMVAIAYNKDRGVLYVSDGGPYGENKYYGKVGMNDGVFVPSHNAPAGIAPLLQAISEDPEKASSDYGRLNGRCCFCDTELDDERSTHVGYGPTCAKNFGLPWGGSDAPKPTKKSREITAKFRPDPASPLTERQQKILADAKAKRAHDVTWNPNQVEDAAWNRGRASELEIQAQEEARRRSAKVQIEEEDIWNPETWK